MDRVNVTSGRAAAVLRWAARIWSLAALLILGAFFVEHLSWFAQRGAPPPWWVFLAQACHLLLLAGLLLAWRWEWQGAALALLGAAGFFAAIGFDADVVPFMAVMAFPAVPWIVRTWIVRRAANAWVE